MKPDDAIYLRHILDAIEKIERYLQGYVKDTFLRDTLVQDGVIRQLEIISEATKQLSQELRIQYSHIPWQDIAGMRDVLIHHYFGVDIDKVWLTTQEDILFVKAEAIKILEKLQLG